MQPVRSLLIAMICAATPVLAEERGPLRFSVDGGVVFGTANEVVYDEGNRGSHLIWKLAVPTVRVGLDYELESKWTITGAITAGKSGGSRMVDYDWMGPNFVSYGFDDWTHRSISENTDVNHYYKLELGAEYDLIEKSDVTLSGLVGISYTSAKWTAYSGTFIYSDSEPGDGCGFRGCIGELDPGRGIDYVQKLPSLYLGVEGRRELGRFTLSGQIRVGATVNGRDIDNHYLRNLRFDESFDTTGYLGLGARIDFQPGKRGNWYASVELERTFHSVGDAKVTNTETGETDFAARAAGLDLSTARVAVGYSLSF